MKRYRVWCLPWSRADEKDFADVEAENEEEARDIVKWSGIVLQVYDLDGKKPFNCF